MNIRDFLIEELIKVKVCSPRLEADIILKNFAPDYPNISAKEEENVERALMRRINLEPLDKIIGKKEFYKFNFTVSCDVLSPRPDTEILVEEALRLLDNDKKYKIIDLGTGSGCILLSLLKERKYISGTGVDISNKALKIAELNAKNLDVSDRVSFINENWNKLDKQEEFDVIVSNPPYIPHFEFLHLEKEVKDFDPYISLVGGEDGLDCYREIALISPKILKIGGYILLEVGYNQAEDVAKIFCKEGFTLVKIVKDLANINRCVILKK